MTETATTTTSADKKWYVVRAISGKEKKVKLYIESEIAHNKIGHYVSQVLIPTEKYYQIKDGKKVSLIDLEHGDLPDPVRELKNRIRALQKEVETLDTHLKTRPEADA